MRIRTKDTDQNDQGLDTLYQNRLGWEYRRGVKVKGLRGVATHGILEEVYGKVNRGVEKCQDALVLAIIYDGVVMSSTMSQCRCDPSSFVPRSESENTKLSRSDVESFDSKSKCL